MAGAALLAALLLQGAAAPTAAPDIAADARCFTVMAFAASATDAKAKQAGMMGALLWYGRLSAQLPAAGIADAIKAEAKRMEQDSASIQAEAQRCSAEMTAYGQAMQALGAEMRAEAGK
ncbi:hypothetical protein [Sphingomonas flavalba]|uniref:hypothetical protein n=1 Tax=Sphingomonas flavalba TaxID=2559804 RepID=UPI00109E0B5D|nr:hypothetical protein [Sphingomonas flavalba]